MKEISLIKQIAKTLSYKRRMDKEAPAEALLVIGDGNGAADHSIYKLFVIYGRFTLLNHDQFGFQLLWIDHGILSIML